MQSACRLDVKLSETRASRSHFSTCLEIVATAIYRDPFGPNEVRSSRRASPTSLSGGNRRVLFDELALLQLRPELRRDPGQHGTVVRDDLLLACDRDTPGRGDGRRRADF